MWKEKSLKYIIQKTAIDRKRRKVIEHVISHNQLSRIKEHVEN